MKKSHVYSPQCQGTDSINTLSPPPSPSNTGFPLLTPLSSPTPGRSLSLYQSMIGSGSVPPPAVEMFFFPFVGGGHQIPMIDIARVFAAHGASSTILAAPSSTSAFQNSIAGDQRSGRPIKVHTLRLPENAASPDADMSAAPFTDTSALQEPLRELLIERKPDCIVVDMFHRWSAEVNAADGEFPSKFFLFCNSPSICPTGTRISEPVSDPG